MACRQGRFSGARITFRLAEGRRRRSVCVGARLRYNETVVFSSYSSVLRGALGEPWAVSDRLWRELTSIEEGDEAAYGRALRQVGDMTRRCFLGARPNRVDRAQYTRFLRDARTPVAALELLFSAEWVDNNMRADIAAHRNVAERLEEVALRSGSHLVREALAGNPSVSGETIDVLRRSRSRYVVGKLLSNSALDGQVLRECVGKARGLGMSEGEIAGHGCVNASMPEDVVLSWLSGGDERARAEALSSPLCPRGDLWRYLTGEGANARSEGLDSRVFSGWSNADGSMVDYYASGVVADIVRGDTGLADERTLWLALHHPRAWGVTVEKIYTMVEPTLRMLASVMGSPACPEWVWEDALARFGRLLALSDNYVFVKAERVFDAAWLSGRHARRLLDEGVVCHVASVACASPGALVRVADFALARSPVWKWLLRDVAAHRNTPPEVRRELVRWFPESLWLVARDGFLGRARLQK